MAKKVSKANNKKENSKNKKSFFKDFKAELKKVIWPTPKQLINNTTAVVVIVLITAAIVFVLDMAFESLNEHGIDKVKEVVQQTNSVTESTENQTLEDETSQENSEDVTEGIVEDSTVQNDGEVENTESSENIQNNAE